MINWCEQHCIEIDFGKFFHSSFHLEWVWSKICRRQSYIFFLLLLRCRILFVSSCFFDYLAKDSHQTWVCSWFVRANEWLGYEQFDYCTLYAESCAGVQNFYLVTDIIRFPLIIQTESSITSWWLGRPGGHELKFPPYIWCKILERKTTVFCVAAGNQLGATIW